MPVDQSTFFSHSGMLCGPARPSSTALWRKVWQCETIQAVTIITYYVDGSKVAAALVIADQSVAAATDTKVVVMVKGPAEVSQGALALDATYDDATKKGVVYASLEAVGINILTTN